MGVLSSGIWGGVSVGPAIGQALGTLPRVAIFLTASSLAVLAFTYFTDEELRPKAVVPSRWFPPAVVLPGLILGCGNVTYAAMSGFLVLLLRERGHDTRWAFSAFAFAVLFGRFMFGGLPDRWGPRRTLLTGYVFFGVGLVIIALSRNSLLDVPASLLIGLGYAFPWPALALTVVNRVRVSERASALGAAHRVLRRVCRRQFRGRRRGRRTLRPHRGLLVRAAVYVRRRGSHPHYLHRPSRACAGDRRRRGRT